MTAATSAAERTGTEALHAKLQTDDYFKDKKKDLSVTARYSGIYRPTTLPVTMILSHSLVRKSQG